jgi:hypothetical protein
MNHKYARFYAYKYVLEVLKIGNTKDTGELMAKYANNSV